LLVLFPEIYIHFEIFSYDLLHACVLFQWMDRLCVAVTEVNHTYPSVHSPYFLEYVSLEWEVRVTACYVAIQQYYSYSSIIERFMSLIAMIVDSLCSPSKICIK
jgi:hypothetical protein